MQTRWAWWAYTVFGSVVAAGPVGSVQYNGAGNLAGESAFSYDDVTNTLSLDKLLLTSQPSLFGFEDDYSGNKAVGILGSGGAAIVTLSSYTDEEHFTGLLISSDGDDHEIQALVDENNVGTLTITTGNGNISMPDTAGSMAINTRSGGQLVLQSGDKEIVAAGPLLFTQAAAFIRGGTAPGDSLKIGAYDTDTGPAFVYFVDIVAGTAPSFTLSPPAGGATVTVKANTLAAVADVAGTAAMTTVTNGTAVAGANAYVIQGGQAPATVNTGFLKLYVGTNAVWVPYWQNATP